MSGPYLFWPDHDAIAKREDHVAAIGPNPNPHAKGYWHYDRGAALHLMELCGRPVPFYNLYAREPREWSRERAASAARRFVRAYSHRAVAVLMLGTKVCSAFGVTRPEWLRTYDIGDGMEGVAVPHPSGLNRWYNDPANRRRAEMVLRDRCA